MLSRLASFAAAVLLLSGVQQAFAVTSCDTNHEPRVLEALNRVLDAHRPAFEAREDFTATLPVVFHGMFHPRFTAAEKAAFASQVAREMDFMNRWYRAENSRFATRARAFESVTLQGASGIQFRLANKDPSGNPTSGITQHDVTFATCGSDDASLDRMQAVQPMWDKTRYINIYMCDLSGNLLGFAFFPSESNTGFDGIVDNWSTLATDFDNGNTISHEMGHFLGLPHTFDGSTCSTDPARGDAIADTPPTDSPTSTRFPNQGCAANVAGAQAFVNCNNVVMTENVMDYNSEDCVKIMTNGQIARIKMVLDVPPRRSLRFSDALSGSCVPNCQGRACGDNGCGGSCGACPTGQSCNATFACVGNPGCVPNCANRNCGDNGCGGSCGSCSAGTTCTAGVCRSAINNQVCTSPITLTPGTPVNYDTTNVTLSASQGTVCAVGTTPGLYYTVAGTGTVMTVTTCTATNQFDTVMQIVRGSPCSQSSTCIGEFDDTSSATCNLGSSFTGCFSSGDNFGIYIEGFDGRGSGQISVTNSNTPCSFQTGRSCSGATSGATNTGAFEIAGTSTESLVENSVSCATPEQIPANFQWFKLASPTSRRFRVSTCNAGTPSFDSIVEVRSGSCSSSGTCIAFNDDAESCPSNEFASDLEFCAEANTQYFIGVRSFANSQGSFRLSVTDEGACACTANCINKNCGDDGCGGSCGSCDSGFSCSVQGQCEGNNPAVSVNPSRSPQGVCVDFNCRKMEQLCSRFGGSGVCLPGVGHCCQNPRLPESFVWRVKKTRAADRERAAFVRRPGQVFCLALEGTVTFLRENERAYVFRCSNIRV